MSLNGDFIGRHPTLADVTKLKTMLEEWIGSPAVRTLGEYLTRPETSIAVLLPGIASLVILCFYARAGKISGRLKLLWLMALPVSFYCARWESSPEVQQLYVYSAFSVVCMLLLFKRVYIPPALAYALTFLSMWWVDVTHALCHALECGSQLDRFYFGIGGAGIYDALFLVPLFTALAVGYATARMRSRGESFHTMNRARIAPILSFAQMRSYLTDAIEASPSDPWNAKTSQSPQARTAEAKTAGIGSS